MSRGGALPGGIANLNDTIQVVDRDGTDLGMMIVAEAQKIASEQGSRAHRDRPQSEDGVDNAYEPHEAATYIFEKFAEEPTARTNCA
jgi:hypothetical protein